MRHVKKTVLDYIIKTLFGYEYRSYGPIIIRLAICVVILLAIFIFPRPLRDSGFITTLIDMIYSILFFPTIILIPVYLIELEGVAERSKEVPVSFSFDQIIRLFSEADQVECTISHNNNTAYLCKYPSTERYPGDIKQPRNFISFRDWVSYSSSGAEKYCVFYDFSEFVKHVYDNYCDNNTITVKFLKLYPPVIGKPKKELEFMVLLIGHRRVETDLIALKKHYEDLENNQTPVIFSYDQVMQWFSEKDEVECVISHSDGTIYLCKFPPAERHPDSFNEPRQSDNFRDQVHFSSNGIGEFRIYYDFIEFKNYVFDKYCDKNMIAVKYLKLKPQILDKHKKAVDLIALKRYYTE